MNSPAVEMVRLKERHGEIEKRLTELDRHLSLTPDEQVERAQLKKEKLRAKDRLAALAAHVAGDAAPGDPLPA
ncbi:MAG TPA: YdcH family protein [Polyangia bacterium]